MLLLVRFLRELKPYLKTMAFVAVLTFVNAILSLQVPAVIGHLFNFLDPEGKKGSGLPAVFLPIVRQGVWGYFALIVGISLVSGALGYFMSVTVTALGQLFTYNTRQKLYAHLQTLSQGYFEKAQTGKIVSTIVNDVGQINQLITGGFINIIQDSRDARWRHFLPVLPKRQLGFFGA